MVRDSWGLAAVLNFQKTSIVSLSWVNFQIESSAGISMCSLPSIAKRHWKFQHLRSQFKMSRKRSMCSLSTKVERMLKPTSESKTSSDKRETSCWRIVCCAFCHRQCWARWSTMNLGTTRCISRLLRALHTNPSSMSGSFALWFCTYRCCKTTQWVWGWWSLRWIRDTCSVLSRERTGLAH